MSNVFIYLKGLRKDYKGFSAIKSINLKIGEPQNIAILGPNGSGKSTLIKLLAGILYPTEGEIRIMGFKPYEKRKEYLMKISYLNPQKTRLIYDVTGWDNIYLFGSAYGLGFKEIKRRAEKLADMLNIQNKLNSYVRTLSFGERVKIELITGLLHEPQLILLDEPFVGLDFISRKTIKEFLLHIKKNVVITSHMLDAVLNLAKYVIVLNKGEVVYCGAWDELYRKVEGKKTFVLYVNERKGKIPGFIRRGEFEYVALIDETKTRKLYDEFATKSWVEKIEVQNPDIEDVIRDLLQND